MTRTLEIHVKRDEITRTRKHQAEIQDPEPGQVLVAIDKFALTANNVTYAVAGDTIGYWQFYPVAGDWGIVPVWGIGEVVASNNPEAPVGERLYGFFPMASHALLTLASAGAGHYREVSDHRRELPAVYNSYRRTAADPEFLRDMEEERCLYFPLFMTSFLIYDFLLDNELFGAQRVLIGSASSKTAFGLASLLHSDDTLDIAVVGLTSEGNKAFVQSLGYYDQVVAYGQEADIDPAPATVYVDMAGNAGLTARVHTLLGDQIAYSCAVGATHWQHFGTQQSLPGPAPEFFFAPAQIAKREEEWGRGVIMDRAGLAVGNIVKSVADGVEIRRIKDVDSAMSTWVDLVENRVPANSGLLLSLVP